MPAMSLRSRAIVIYALAVSLALLFCASFTSAQTDATTVAFDEGETDPVKLFERGQDAHGNGQLEVALQFYEAAIKLRPEFPEAEYQRGIALNSLNRLPAAEQALRRATELRGDWALSWAMLGMVLVRSTRFDEAEQALDRALKLEPKNHIALSALMDLRLRTKAPRQSLQLLLKQLQDATASEDAPASTWAARGAIERALEDKVGAMASLDHALKLDPGNSVARTERAELYATGGDYEHAIADARALPGNAQSKLLLARIYAQAGRKDEALSTLDALDEKTRSLPEAVALRNAVLTDGATAEGRAALEKMLEREPGNAALLARLGALYRTDDPLRAVEYYRRALAIEPRNADYATGYGAALVQARRFADAVTILRQVVAVASANYAAHANLATALYELRRFAEALAEFRWVVAARPELAATYFFIATAHDFLGEYEEALAAYQTFLSRADAEKSQLEIEKVKLRLPTLRNQIKHGEGKKRNKS